jgi:predicted RNA-binding Zn-ribbon protein involved in translation (DUF1610 family)
MAQYVPTCVTKHVLFATQRPSQQRELSVYGTSHEVDDTGSAVREERVTTCTACKVTIHHHQQPGPRLRAACPFCGQPYIAATSIAQQTEQRPVGVGVGAGRVHGQRSCSDPMLPSFRLPAIVSTRSETQLSDTCPNHLPNRH